MSDMSDLKKIYCAGPLFNDSEKREMDTIATVLEKSRYETFLPHRDGLEYAAVRDPLMELGVSSEEVDSILLRAIFALDVYQVCASDGLVLNMNGRVPDEGAMVEAGIAWATGKKIVLFKSDSRTIINGNDNPLVAGLSGFHIINQYEEISPEFEHLFKDESSSGEKSSIFPPIKEMIQIGEQISSRMAMKTESTDLCNLLLSLFGRKTDDGSQRVQQTA